MDSGYAFSFLSYRQNVPVGHGFGFSDYRYFWTVTVTTFYIKMQNLLAIRSDNLKEYYLNVL